ncbi:MAG: hypothetical protein ABI338_06230 [Gemmatimonadaceae bacterium]
MKGIMIARMRYVAILGAAVFGLSVAAPSAASAQFSVSVSIGTPPPPLPYYAQPLLPGPDYMWAPGYWAYGPAGYFWVPGAWVLAPEPGMLWTPGYWGASGASFMWYPGYWGRHVGYYGGINYGFGYFGRSYVGGGWYGAHFRYNTAVTNVNTTIVRNVYVDRTVINRYTIDRTTVNHVSYNGGQGGVNLRPSAEQMSMRSQAVPMTAQQQEHQQVAAEARGQLASVNHGEPRSLAVARPFTPQSHPQFRPIRPTDRVAVPQERARPVQPPAARENARGRERTAPRPEEHPVNLRQSERGRPDYGRQRAR